MPLPDLVDRARAALAAGDKAGLFLYARYARERHRRESEATRRPGIAASPGLEELAPVLGEIEKGLADPKAERRLTEARETLSAAQKLKMHAGRRRGEVDGTEERVRQQAAEHIRASL